MTNVLPVPEGDAGYTIPVNSQPAIVTVKQAVCLNSVIKAVFMGERARIDKQKVIIRCDQLPTVLMEEEAVQQVCRLLLLCILDQPPKRGKLFLYIKCNVLEEDAIDMALPDGIQQYEICFHTNSFNKPAWQELFKETLDYCRITCMQYGSNFFYNNSSDGHYLFRVTLPGKHIENATG
jgi:hypothetical protein